MPTNTPADDDTNGNNESDQMRQQNDVEITDEQLGRLVILFWLGILTFPLSLVALFLYFLVRDMLGK